MVKIVPVILLILLVFSFPISASGTYSFYTWYLEEHSEELDMMCDLLAEHELEWGSCIGGDAENIDKSNFFRRYRFDCVNFVKEYEETKSVAALIDADYGFAYFAEEFDCVTDFTKMDGEWQRGSVTYDSHGMENQYIKDMLEGVLEQHPDLDYDSLKYIVHGDSSSSYVYFTDNGEEYLATFPFLENTENEKPAYGDIYKAQDLMMILKPKFAGLEDRKEGYYYGTCVTESQEENTVPLYVYPVAAVTITICVGGGIIWFKRKTHN